MSITTDEKFKKDVLKSGKPVLVDVGATWCGPCKKLSPIVDEVAKEMKDKICVFKMDADENPETVEEYEISGLPTLMIFKGGKLVDSQEGFVSKKELSKWIKEIC